MNTSARYPLQQNYVIFHPSDFSEASEAAFAHALKIALQAKARLEIRRPTNATDLPAGCTNPWPSLWRESPGL